MEVCTHRQKRTTSRRCPSRAGYSVPIEDIIVTPAAGATAVVEVSLFVAKRPPTADMPPLVVDPALRLVNVSGSAAAAGLRVGDVVVAVVGVRTDGVPFRAVHMLIRDHEPGETMRITVERDGEEQTAEIFIASLAPRQ